MSELTLQRLKQVIHYAPETGVFTWAKIRRGIRPGTRAGRRHSDGYIQIQVDHQMFYAHRLAWFYMTGTWPDVQIDHINHDRSDNRFSNLRTASTFQNSMNSQLRPRLNGLPRGVFRRKHCYGMCIRSHGRTHRATGFATPEDASEFYKLAAEMLHGEFAYHLSRPTDFQKVDHHAG